MHGLCPFDLVRRDLGQADVPGFARRDGLRHRTPALLQRHLRIHAVQLVEIHVIGAEPLQAAVDRRADVLGPAVQRPVARVVRRVRGLDGVPDDADLGGQHRAIAMTARQRPADQFLVGVRPVGVGGVDQRHAEIKRLADHRDRRGLVSRRLHVVGERHAHAAQADDANLGSVTAQRRGSHHLGPSLPARSKGASTSSYERTAASSPSGPRSWTAIPAWGGRSWLPQRTQLYSRAERVPSSVIAQYCRSMPPPALKQSEKKERSSPAPRRVYFGPKGPWKYPPGSKVLTIASVSPVPNAAW